MQHNEIRFLSFGSLNIDNVYRVPHIVTPGETLSSLQVSAGCGGKGLNQSIALAKAGASVWHAGMVGEDGQMLLDKLQEADVHTELIQTIAGKSGHTIIQVDENGQNSIILAGGANQSICEEYVDKVLAGFGEGDVLLLQNEINNLPYIVDKAFEKGMRIVLNPSPMNEKIFGMDLEKISLFLLNEVEGAQLLQMERIEKSEDSYMEVLARIQERYPNAEIVLTLGTDGSVYSGRCGQIRQHAMKVKAVDTTAAGDTFTGYFLREYYQREDVEKALSMATKASAIAVTREGAADSIPCREEVL
ncbi:MAG: ribokinase [Bariatricus sp.]